MEDVTDADYTLVKRGFKDFKIKKLGEFHDLYVQSDSFLLADAFKNFQNTCLETHELDPAHIFTAQELAWQTALKKTKVKLDLLNDINKL